MLIVLLKKCQHFKYCDPDLRLICGTKLDGGNHSSERLQILNGRVSMGTELKRGWVKCGGTMCGHFFIFNCSMLQDMLTRQYKSFIIIQQTIRCCLDVVTTSPLGQYDVRL